LERSGDAGVAVGIYPVCEGVGDVEEEFGDWAWSGYVGDWRGVRFPCISSGVEDYKLVRFGRCFGTIEEIPVAAARKTKRIE
jgi:hypothetical protein